MFVGAFKTCKAANCSSRDAAPFRSQIMSNNAAPSGAVGRRRCETSQRVQRVNVSRPLTAAVKRGRHFSACLAGLHVVCKTGSVFVEICVHLSNEQRTVLVCSGDSWPDAKAAFFVPVLVRAPNPDSSS